MFRLVALDDARASNTLRHGDRLGRQAGCAFTATHPSVSRVHARIERRGDAWFVVDEASRNGVFVRGERVGEVELVDGLELRLGEFALRAEAAAAAHDVPPDTSVSAPIAPASPSRTASRAATGAAPAPIAEDFEFDVAEDDGGLELEDPAAIKIGSADTAPKAAAAPAPTSAAQQRQAQYLAEESRARSGLVRGELTQQPGWVQALVWLGVLLFGAALAWGIASLL
jgi:predicted component of type VI protein secretion system